MKTKLKHRAQTPLGLAFPQSAPTDDVADALDALLERLGYVEDDELEFEFEDDDDDETPKHLPPTDDEAAEIRLSDLFRANAWLRPDSLEAEISRAVGENASLKSRRRKVIAIADRVGAALAPNLACKPGCSDCCHMNTMIYEHEAVRLAEVTGRPMTRLPYRPRDVVYRQGDKYNGQPCPFLVQDRCSVYEDRPMVCRTHHSLNSDATACKIADTPAEQRRPVMYNPDLLEVPYMELNQMYNQAEPWGNIAEFFPSGPTPDGAVGGAVEP